MIIENLQDTIGKTATLEKPFVYKADARREQKTA
jgi:hypothetical protein